MQAFQLLTLPLSPKNWQVKIDEASPIPPSVQKWSQGGSSAATLLMQSQAGLSCQSSQDVLASFLESSPVTLTCLFYGKWVRLKSRSRMFCLTAEPPTLAPQPVGTLGWLGGDNRLTNCTTNFHSTAESNRINLISFTHYRSCCIGKQQMNGQMKSLLGKF